MTEEIIQQVANRLMGHSKVIQLTHMGKNPYYDREVIEPIVRFLPKLFLLKMLGDSFNPLEQLGWHVIDDLAKYQTGLGIIELVKEIEKEVKNETRS